MPLEKLVYGIVPIDDLRVENVYIPNDSTRIIDDVLISVMPSFPKGRRNRYATSRHMQHDIHKAKYFIIK